MDQYLKLLQYNDSYCFETFLNMRPCLAYIKNQYVRYKLCCNDQDPVNGEADIVCNQCGMILDTALYEFHYNFKNVGVDGKNRANSGVVVVPEKRPYKQITNLKMQYKQYMGWRINSAVYCESYNLYAKCSSVAARKCRCNHKCFHCDGSHAGVKCPNPNWIEKIEFSVDDRNAYAVVRNQLKKMNMSWQYRNIFSIIYELGGRRPAHSARDTERIIIALIVVQNFYNQGRVDVLRRGRGMKKCRSLGSSKMLLSAILNMLDKEPFYHIPSLKNHEAHERVLRFFYSFTNYVSPELVLRRSPEIDRHQMDTQ